MRAKSPPGAVARHKMLLLNADTAAALVCADPRRARLLHVQSIEPITLVRWGLQDDNDFELIRSLRFGTEQLIPCPGSIS